MRSSGGFVNAEADFVAPATAMSGASDMIVEVMGVSGRHSRTTIGVAPLPREPASRWKAFAFE